MLSFSNYFICTCPSPHWRCAFVRRPIPALVWQSQYTALILAVQYGHANCARLLINAGADKEAKTLVLFHFFRSAYLFCFFSVFA